MNNPQRQLGVGLQQTFFSSEGAEYNSISRPFRAKDLTKTYPQLALGVIQITPLRGTIYLVRDKR